MSIETRFFVPGVPVPKGSAKAFYNKKAGRVIVMQDNRDKQQPWASLISLSAQNTGMIPSDCACRLTLVFIMPRPKGHLRTNGQTKPSAPLYHTKKPDLDKLTRCVKDALTGIAYQDDSQVTLLFASKRYVDAGKQTGCEITVKFEN